ncbi:MAG: YccF domain-containing protein [Candidatus Campbellbacteria bacterium]|nr:YccF domain-containing protein [Candidatus Campbellbacteria bacterium]
MAIIRTGFVMELFEAVAARLGVDWLVDKGKKSTTETPSATQASDQKEDRMDWHLLINNDSVLPLKNRKILHEAVEKLSPDDRDRAEQAIGKVLSDGRDGFFKARSVVTMTQKSSESRKGDDSKTVKETTESSKSGVAKTVKETTESHKGGDSKSAREPVTREVYPKGFEPESLTVEFLRSSTNSLEAADLFLAMLLQKSRTQQAREAAKKALDQVEKFVGNKLWWFFGTYLALLIISLVGWVVCFSAVITSPEAFSTFMWGLVWFALFVALSTPIAKLLLPKE